MNSRGASWQILVVACAEDDTVVIHVEDAVVGDGDPVGVEAKIAEERVWLLEGGFSVNHPVLPVQRVFQPGESRGLKQCGDALGNARRDGELTFVEESREAGEEFATKEFAEDLDRKQVFLVGIAPPAIGIKATAGALARRR